jgi:hypothetical protein
MTRSERRTGLILVFVTLALFVFAVEGIISSKDDPPPAAMTANLAATVLSFVGSGYVARKRGHSRVWALLGFLSWIGIVVSLCLKDRRGREREAQVTPSALPDARVATPAGRSQAGENPECPGCGTVYNRKGVVRQLRQQSPEMFDYAVWTTKFRCVKCGAVLVITGEAHE